MGNGKRLVKAVKLSNVLNSSKSTDNRDRGRTGSGDFVLEGFASGIIFHLIG